MDQRKTNNRIVILGGGFGGVYTALGLQDIGDPTAEVTLISRNNYFLMTPLLFEAGSGVLEPRHAVNPIRPLLRSVHFIEAEITGIDLDRKVVRYALGGGENGELAFDHLVLAMGGITNTRRIPGSRHALTFKTLSDAIYLRNHIIQIFERADVEHNPERKSALLSFVLVGGGLVNIELCGELTEFLKVLQKLYHNIAYSELRVTILESEASIGGEFHDSLKRYIRTTLEKRGVEIRLNARVKEIEPGVVHLPDGTSLAAQTVVLGTGVVPSPLVASLPIEKDDKGRALVEPTMLCKGRPNLWALGDCAHIPDRHGKPYPELAQHALHEARQLSRNIAAVIRGQSPEPFVYESKGTLAALGHGKGVAKLSNIHVRGFLAWWIWRTYYLLQMRGWSRRIRIILDWTIALFFKNDIVQLDLHHVRGD